VTSTKRGRGERGNLGHVLNRTAAVTGLGDNEVGGKNSGMLSLSISICDKKIIVKFLKVDELWGKQKKMADFSSLVTAHFLVLPTL